MARSYFYIREAAALLGCSTQWVTRKVNAGEFEANRLARGRWRIPRRFLLDYAEIQGVELDFEALNEESSKTRKPYVRSQPVEANGPGHLVLET